MLDSVELRRGKTACQRRQWSVSIHQIANANDPFKKLHEKSGQARQMGSAGFLLLGHFFRSEDLVTRRKVLNSSLPFHRPRERERERACYLNIHVFINNISEPRPWGRRE